MQQGGLANSSGSTLEQTVIGTLQSKGFSLVRYRDWQKNPEKYGDELLLRNVPYQTIYNHQGNTEFLLRSARYQLEVRIECKWQQASGSVDEKFPYLYLNCIEQMPERDIIIVVDGGGAKQGSVEWLRQAAKSRRYIQTDAEKNILVMNLTEFLVWANRTLR
jgi:hypothetical protein